MWKLFHIQYLNIIMVIIVSVRVQARYEIVGRTLRSVCLRMDD